MEIAYSVAFGLVSMLAYGIGNAYSKPISQRLGASRTLFLRGLSICTLLLLASLPSLTHSYSSRAVIGTLLLGMAGYIPVLAFTHGIKISRLGIIAPIAGTSPLITVLLAFFFLGAAISTPEWFAIILIVLANIVASVNLRNWRESNLFKLGSGIPYAVVASVGWGLFFFGFIYSTHELGPWLATLIAEAGVTIAAGLHLMLTRQPLQLREALTRPVISNALLVCIGTIAFALGVRYFNIGIVVALSNSTALVDAILGTLLFHERLTRLEILAGAGMVLGVVFIALA